MSLKEDSIKIDEHNWYYEEAKGLCMVHEILDEKTKEHIQTDIFYIPWKRVLESVRRKYPELLK